MNVDKNTMKNKKRAEIYRNIARFMADGWRTNWRYAGWKSEDENEYLLGICLAYRCITGDESSYAYSFSRLIEAQLPELELVNERENIDSYYFLKCNAKDRQNICLLMSEMVTNPIYDDGILGDD